MNRDSLRSVLARPMATYTKLKSGEWGIRVDGTATRGEAVTVTKKSGQTATETIARVLWTGRDNRSGETISLCTIEQRERSSSSGYVPAVRDSRGYVTERGHHAGYCGYPCPVTGRKCCPANGPCHDCQ